MAGRDMQRACKRKDCLLEPKHPIGLLSAYCMGVISTHQSLTFGPVGAYQPTSRFRTLLSPIYFSGTILMELRPPSEWKPQN